MRRAEKEPGTDRIDGSERVSGGGKKKERKRGEGGVRSLSRSTLFVILPFALRVHCGGAK